MSDHSSSVIRIGLPGASGRMGRMITRAASEDDHAMIASATDHPQSDLIGADTGIINNLGESGVVIGSSLDDLFANNPDVIVDFTAPDASIAHAEAAAERGIPIVIGTTGLADNHIAALEEAAEKIAIVRCANTSVGVTMLDFILAHAVWALGEDWDIEIVETHHKHKVDAPSGTALALGEAVAQARKVKLDDVAEYGRNRRAGARKDGAIGFASVRGGDVVGEHSVIFHGESERIEITHRAFDRMIFARGAIRAARWVFSAESDLYSMSDVLWEDVMNRPGSK